MEPITTAAIISAIASLGSSIYNSVQSRKQSLADYDKQRSDALTDRAWQVNYNSPASQVSRLKAAGLPNRDVQDVPVSAEAVPDIKQSSLPFAPSFGASVGDVFSAADTVKDKELARDAQRANIAKVEADTNRIIADATLDRETKAHRLAEIIARSDKSLEELKSIRIANDNAIKSGKLTTLQIDARTAENRLLEASEPLTLARWQEELRGIKVRNDISEFELTNMLPEQLSALRQSILINANRDRRDNGKYAKELEQMDAYLQLTLLKGDTEKLQQALTTNNVKTSDLSLKFAADTYEANIAKLKADLKCSEAEAKTIALRQCIGIVKDIAVGIGSVAGGIGVAAGKFGVGVANGAASSLSPANPTYSSTR